VDPRTTPSTAEKPAFVSVAQNLFRREPSGSYYAVLKRAGKQIWKSLKTRDRKLAERRLKEFLAQAASLRPQDNPHISFPALAERWLDHRRHTVKESTVARAKRSLKAVTPFFAGVSVRNLTLRHCDAWVSSRGLDIAPQTFAHELDTMRGVFAYAIEIGLRVDNPAAHIKRKPIRAMRPSVPSRHQFRQLVATIRQSDGRADSQAKAKGGADLVELLAYSGCRLDEARNLRWRDVDFDRDVFTLTGGERGTKNQEPRTVPMNDALRQLLKRLHSDGNPQPEGLIVKIKSARKCIDTATRRLGLPHLTHHTFRHFFATTAIESGGDIPTVAKMLGHKDGGALLMKTYGHLRQEHAFTVAKRINFGTEQPANIVRVPALAANEE
jgi:integrase